MVEEHGRHRREERKHVGEKRGVLPLDKKIEGVLDGIDRDQIGILAALYTDRDAIPLRYLPAISRINPGTRLVLRENYVLTEHHVPVPFRSVSYFRPTFVVTQEAVESTWMTEEIHEERLSNDQRGIRGLA